MKIIFIFLSLFIAYNCRAQLMSRTYYSNIKKADSVFKIKLYKEASLAYLNAFAANGYTGTAYDRYSAACAMAMAGMTDSAFAQLEHIVAIDVYDDYTRLLKDTDFHSLYVDKRWEKLCDHVKVNKEKAEAKLNKPLMSSLDTILNDDQEDRMKLGGIAKKYGTESVEYKQLCASQLKKDL